jgi:mRNA interferase MazF
VNPLPRPRRGEVWWANLSPVQGHEQAGQRPCLVVSADAFNRLPHGLLWIVPMTTNIRQRHVLTVPVEPPEGGLPRPSAVLCHQLRTISLERLANRAGLVSDVTLAEVRERIGFVLDE